MPDFSGMAEMKLKRITPWAQAIALLLWSSILWSQQEPQYTHNMFTQMAVNPAYAGSSGDISVTGLMREQWMGFKDLDGNKVAPQTFLLSMDMPVNLLRGGIGITILNDKLGFEKNIGLRLNYAYRIEFWKGAIAFGPVIGFLNKSIDFSMFKPTQPGDPILASAEEKTMMLDLGLGIFYELPKKYFAGISTSQLLQTSATLGMETANFNLKRHYYLQGGFYYILPDNPLIRLEPSIMLKTDFVSSQLDLNTLAIYNDKFWGGLSYRYQDALALLVGITYKSFKLGYSYDITTSKLGGAGSTGSHEIVLNYRFKLELEKNPKGYRNTRYL